MKLSLDIFYYQLQPQASALVMQNAIHDFSISEVRIYTPGTILRSDTLYIGPADSFLQNLDPTPICFNNGNYIPCPDTDLFTLLNKTLEIFHHFATWEERCTYLLETHAPLEDLLNTGEEIIGFPMLVVDISQFIISHSTSMSESVEISTDNSYDHSSMPIELLKEFNQIHADSFKAKKTFWLPADFFPTKSACHHIFLNNLRAGTVIVAYSGEPNTNYLSQMIELFVPMVQKWFLYAKSADSSANTTSLLAQALDGKPEACTDLEHYLHLFGWKSDQPKQLFIARTLSENVHFDSHFSRALNNEVKGIFCIPYQKSLTILCNYGLIKKSTFHKRFQQMLQRSNYYAISTSDFTDLTLLPELYQLIRLAGNNLSPEIGQIYNGALSTFPLIAQTVHQHLHVPVIHPILEQIREYDRLKHSNYYDTLFAFLRFERNHQLTADSLYIHRNTLFLRLRKIQELWNLDLENPSLRFYLLYCFNHLQIIEQFQRDEPRSNTTE